MNNAAKEELIDAASSLAYDHIKHSGLFRELSPNEWEALADLWAADVFALLEDRVNDFLTKKEAESVGI